MTNYPRQFGLVLILTCTLVRPSRKARFRRFSTLTISPGWAGPPRRLTRRSCLVFTRPAVPFCARAKQDHLEPLNANPAYAQKSCCVKSKHQRDDSFARLDGAMTTHADFARK